MNRLSLLGLTAVLLLPAAAPAATVSGTLAGGKGYTVLAMAPSGQSAVAKVGGDGKFALKLKGAGSTLQLVTPTGRYFGPVVLGKAGRKALVTLSGKGGKLGRLTLKDGFAAVKAPRKAVSKSGAVRTAKNGGPLGAGRLGFVRMKAKGRAVAAATNAGATGAGADPDKDGVPSTFDADDNGNLTMDGVDPQTARTSTAGLFSDLEVMMSRALNANAAGISTAAVDTLVKENTSLNFYLDDHYARGATVSSVDVDCGALPYCRSGDGFATMGDGGNSPTGVQNQKWITLDANHDGFPDVPVNRNGDQSHGAVHSIEIKPNATTADLHAGDLYQVRFTTPGGVLTVPTALSLFFVSSPALASYDGGAGPVAITYPASDSSTGSDQNPLQMSGDKITLTFWRPQRAGFDGEADFVDMGHLRYGVPLSLNGRELGCGATRYSGLSSTLRPAAGGEDGIYNQLFPLQDAANDATPSASNTLKLTFDLGGCLRANGIDPAGQTLRLPLQAVDESRPGGTDRTGLTIAVCLPGCTPPQQNGPQQGGPQQNGPQQGAPAGALADLAIDGFTNADVGGNCELTVDLVNRGEAMSSPSQIGVSATGGVGDVTSSFGAQNVAAGAHSSVVGTIAGACAGRTIALTADVGNTVNESSEGNNGYQRAVGA
ncbi:MAG: CARDB domain-containing protein [Solirubrobacteraceae bacterium]